jgi:hypothetical protein
MEHCWEYLKAVEHNRSQMKISWVMYPYSHYPHHRFPPGRGARNYHHHQGHLAADYRCRPDRCFGSCTSPDSRNFRKHCYY